MKHTLQEWVSDGALNIPDEESESLEEEDDDDDDVEEELDESEELEDISWYLCFLFFLLSVNQNLIIILVTCKKKNPKEN